jgi:TP901 family phage tail tape measure protein
MAVRMSASGDLPRTLKEAAREARTLNTNLAGAKTEVRDLAAASRAASRDVRRLGRDSRSAARGVDTLASSARAAQRQLALISRSSASSHQELRLLRTESTQTGRDLRRMSAQVNSTIRDLTRMSAALRTARTRAGSLGTSGARQVRTLDSAIMAARSHAGGLVSLLAGGALIAGGAELVKNGNELTQALNTFGATSQATSMQMARAGQTANKLGEDLTLPKVSAVEAADAMVELSKAGFRTDQAIDSSRAALLLSAAAQTDAADSAKYLGDMMDQFGLGADQAGKAADILAATANAASGGVKDIYYAMKYAGPVAHGLGVNMEDAATGVGMLAKAGILGHTAGTSLRGIFVNLSKPTAMMADGLKTLGINAYDAQGNFKGLRYIIERLQEAQEKLSQKDFTAAAAKAFGKPALSGAVALAHQGVQSYDALALAVRRQGAAQQIAAAQGKGLSGAMVQLRTQSKQTGLAIYQGMSPALEFLTRGITSAMAKSTPKITEWFQHFNSAAYLFGPDLKREAGGIFGAIGREIRDVGSDFKDFGTDVAAGGLNVLLNVGKAAVDVLRNLVDAATPVVDALGDVSSNSDGVANSLDTAVAVVDKAASAVGSLSGVLVPIGHVVGALVEDFGRLPGPVQAAILALLLARRITPVMNRMAGSVTGRVMPALRGFRDEMRVQRSLAASSGVSLSRYGAAFAALETRVPVIGRIAGSFRSASTAGTGFTGTLRGVTAAAGTGLRAGVGSFVNFLGGPWGVALAAGTLLLGRWAAQQQKAAQATAEHQADVEGLTQAMRKANGVTDEAVREQAASLIQTRKLAHGNETLGQVLDDAGISLESVTDAYLGQGKSLDSVSAQLTAYAQAQAKAAGSNPTDIAKAEAKYVAAAKAIHSMKGEADGARRSAKTLNDAVDGAGNGATAYDKLKTAVAALGDSTADADSRTRALKQALDLLSGGTLDYQAAEAKMNAAITNAKDELADGIKHADGWSKSLLNATGGINTVSKNGQQLYNQLTDITDSTTAAAQAAYDLAMSQNKGVKPAIEAARKEMQRGRDAAIEQAGAYGIQADQAKKVADSVGLIPGQVAILLETRGVDPVLAELLAVQAQLKQTPNKKTIRVDALSADAKKNLEELGYRISLIPGTRQYKITVPTKAARKELTDLINTMAQIPDGKTVQVSADTVRSIRQLGDLQAKVDGMHGRTVTVDALTAAAKQHLEDLGFKIRNTKGKKVEITIPTGTPTTAIGKIQQAINNITGRTIGVGIALTPTSSDKDANGIPDLIQRRQARGSVLDFYADGGTNSGGRRENHVAQMAPAGAWRVWGEPETGGESYIPLSPAKRPRSRAIAVETVRRLGGDPSGIRWHADGSITDWRYDPQTGSLYASTDVGQAAHRTRKVTTGTGKHKKTTEVSYFDERALERKLAASSAATRKWNADLAKVADRAGTDVANALAAMGTDGVALTHKMATGTSKYVGQMASQLRGLAATARASLTDYTRQLKSATTTNAAFEQNLLRLAAMGYGDLAAQLSAQGDTAAQQLAADAAKNKSKASAANAAARRANEALTPDQVTELVRIISAIKSSSVGIHAVADTTGITEDEIVAVAGRAATQIKASLGSRSAKFLADLTRAQKGLSYENGGIRPGVYGTRGGAVTFAEPSTGGEAYVPLGRNKRSAATAVVGDVASRFGLGLTRAGADRHLVVIRQGDTNVTVSTVRTGATGSDIGAQVARGVRRARRGGVNARAN